MVLEELHNQPTNQSGYLETKADSKVGDLVDAGIIGGNDLTLNATMSETLKQYQNGGLNRKHLKTYTGDEDAVGSLEACPGFLLGLRFGI